MKGKTAFTSFGGGWAGLLCLMGLLLLTTLACKVSGASWTPNSAVAPG
jgi:hypothetical protein